MKVLNKKMLKKLTTSKNSIIKKILIQGSIILFALTFSSCATFFSLSPIIYPNDYEVNMGFPKEKYSDVDDVGVDDVMIGGINADFSLGYWFEIDENFYTSARWTFAQRHGYSKFPENSEGKSVESMSQANHVIGYNLFYDYKTPFIEVASTIWEKTNFAQDFKSTGYKPTNLRLGYNWGTFGAFADFKIGKTRLEKSYGINNPSFTIGLRLKGKWGLTGN